MAERDPDVADWLRHLGLERYEQAFRDAEIAREALTELTEADLRELGLPLGPRRLLLKAIRNLSERPAREVTVEADPAGVIAHAPPSSEAERRQLTVMLVDLVGSTALSARLDPEEMREVIRSYQNAVAGEILRYEGHVAKFMGDGVLAYFGYPMAHEDDPERAVHAGLAVVGATADLRTPSGEPLACRVGIATGLVVVGDLIGGGASQEQAVVGETPNLAARLQTLAAPGTVIIAEATRKLLGGLFDCADLGTRMVKGFAEPVRAWVVEREGAAESRFDARHSGRLTPLVGRDHELGLLLDRWARAGEGEGQVVLLQGEPGLGKSRLVQALRERVAGEPHTRLRYQCSPQHTNSALRPVIEHLERAAGLARADPPEVKLDKVVALLGQEEAPLLAELLAIPVQDLCPLPELTPKQRQGRIHAALLGRLERLAAEKPVLMVLEDAHWLDPTTRELFDLTVERLQCWRVLLIVTFRPEFAPPWTGHAHITLLTLNRLGVRQTQAIVAEMAGSKPLPAEVVEQIVSKTDGVPLFVEELTKTVLESSLLKDAGERWQLAGPLAPFAIPSSLHDSLMARLDRLAPVKEVAQVGAAIGREFSYSLLAAVAPLADNDLLAALRQLTGAELVFQRGEPPEATYIFKHALVQDAAYHSLLKSKRHQLHSRIATVLESNCPEIVEHRPELIAHHLAEALRVEDALPYWRKAVEQAVQRYAHHEAIGYARRAISLLDRVADSSARDSRELELQLLRAESALILAGYTAPELREAYQRADELARSTGSISERFRVLDGLWTYHLVLGDAATAYEVSQAMHELASEAADAGYEAFACQASGITSFYYGAFARAHDFLERAVELVAAGHTRRHVRRGGEPIAICLVVDALTLHVLGFPERALVQCEAAVQRADEVGQPYTRAFVRNYGSVLHALRREPLEGAAMAEYALELSREHGFDYLMSAAQMRLGGARVAEDAEQAISLLQRGATTHRALGGTLHLIYGLVQLVEAASAAGMTDAAASALTEADAILAESTLRWCEAEVDRVAGEHFLRVGSFELAESRFAHALETSRRQRARTFELRAANVLARLWIARGELNRAHAILEPVCAQFTEGLETPDLMEARALLGL